jgi:dynein light chain 4
MPPKIVSGDAYKHAVAKPLIKYGDLTAEMAQETLEVMSAAMDKFIASQNWEAAAKLIKETLDKKFSGPWQVLCGEGVGFEVSYQLGHIQLMFYQNVAVLVFKV